MTTIKQAAQQLIDALRQQFCEDDFGQSVRDAHAASERFCKQLASLRQSLEQTDDIEIFQEFKVIRGGPGPRGLKGTQDDAGWLR